MSDTHDLAHQIREALTTIETTYIETLEPARRAAATHTPNTTPQLPLSAAILDIRAATHERLSYWAQLIQRSQHLHQLPDVSVPALTSFLYVHAEHLAEHRWGLKALDELGNSATALAQIAADNAPRRFQVGPCPGTMNGNPCPGIIRATLRADDDLLPSELRCNAETPHAWSSSEWRMLERRLHFNAGAARRLLAVLART
jgi:hypothetical protein